MSNSSSTNPIASMKPKLFQPQEPILSLEQTWLQYFDPEKMGPKERRQIQEPQCG